MRLLSLDSENGARHLVAQGVDVKARDEFGRSVLFYAHSVEMIELLLDAGAEVSGIWTSPFVGSIHNPESHGIGVNALMYHIKDPNIVECLLDRGADVDEVSLTGKTALQYASSEA